MTRLLEVTPGTELVRKENIPMINSFSLAGDIHAAAFGSDGKTLPSKRDWDFQGIASPARVPALMSGFYRDNVLAPATIRRDVAKARVLPYHRAYLEGQPRVICEEHNERGPRHDGCRGTRSAHSEEKNLSAPEPIIRRMPCLVPSCRLGLGAGRCRDADGRMDGFAFSRFFNLSVP